MSERYRLTKIKKCENPIAESAENVEQYRAALGDPMGFSPSIDYYVEGTFQNDPEINQRFVMFRDNRNGVKIPGIMSTTELQSIHDFGNYKELTTQNSVYILEKL